ncbi:hypothetical protein IAU60_000552 [Kwoniella sp. DSM 27419]
MSADLSDPQLGAARDRIQDPNDPTTWLLAHYASAGASTSGQPITLLASGGEPVLPAWQKHLSDSNEEILFGYGDIAGKGLVLLFLKDSVGGVRRARAVVHSRAVASLFPDYSALINIAHASQLTEDLITERLDLHQSSSAPTPVPKYTLPGSDHPNPLSPLAPGGPMPYLATTSTSSRSVSAQHTSVVPHEDEPTHQGSSARYGQLSGPGTPSRRVASSPGQPRVLSLNSTPQRAASPGPALAAPLALDTPQRSQGISSADYSKDDSSYARSRKTSLGARLKSTFTKTSSPSRDEPSTPSDKASTQPNSPTSPSTGRFKSSSLAKAFHRRRSSQQLNASPGDSRQPQEAHETITAGSSTTDFAPPVPPKDSPVHGLYAEPRIPLASASASPGTLGHDKGPTRNEDKPATGETYETVNTSATHLAEPSNGEAATLSPSPSAKKVLSDAAQKRLSAETEIQERFRRDQEQRSRQPSAQANDDDEKSVRLAYDVSDVEDEGGPPMLGAPLPVTNGHDHSTPEQVDQPVEGQFDDEDEPAEASIEQLGTSDRKKQDQLDDDHAERPVIEAEEARRPGMADAHAQAGTEQQRLETERAEGEKQRLKEEAMEADRARLERMQLEEEYRIRAQAEEEARRAEEEAEVARIRAGERARAEAEERAREAALLAEAEAERLRVQHEAEERERVAREEEEKRRREAEEAARLEREEAERVRVEAETQARLRREEEEQRVEAERQRKQSVRDGMLRGKQEGGIMLQGWVTVQTYRSMTWRRRHFHLFPTEMRLYKAEGDAKPIQVIQIGQGSSLTDRYDEAQVKDSFRVIAAESAGQEEFFLFTDSGEDKETVMEGLRMCM